MACAADVRSGSGRPGWPYQGTSGSGAGRAASANGHGPARPGPGAEPPPAGPGAAEPVPGDGPPAESSAPVVGRWAGGTPVTGDLAGAYPPGAANGRAPLTVTSRAERRLTT